MFSRIGAAAIKNNLDNTLALCEVLGNPQKKIKTIHIAGTNGKGSTSHMLAAILQTAGYKTGLYTSPHLKDFRERIRVNGNMIAEEKVTTFVDAHKHFIETIEPSFFEITVAMAFDYFAYEQVDIAVIETGLGGRLDSTNVILPELSIITNIGWDHMNLLGDTLSAIAYEKAGIIKPHTPVVIGSCMPETKPVFIDKSAQGESPIYFAEEHYTPLTYSSDLDTISVTFQAQRTGNPIALDCDLPGLYQLQNMATVLESVHQLKLLGWQINEAAIKEGIAHVKTLTGLQGRWECIKKDPRVIVDVGHNVDGIVTVLRQLQTIAYKQLHWIIGMVSDKEVEKVLSLLPQNAAYYFTKAQIPRAMPEELLQEKAAAFQLKGSVFTDVNQALSNALHTANSEDLILVCGSVFIAGEIDLTKL